MFRVKAERAISEKERYECYEAEECRIAGA